VTYRVRVRSVAEAEFAEATDWYAARSHAAAERFVSSVESLLNHLSEHAHQFPIIFSDIRRVGVPGFPYGVFFRLRGSTCYVIAIMHGRRHPRRWQSRGEV
jgi:toxin ParE2